MPSDDLIARACSGDRAARETLFERHAGKLRMYVEFRLGPALARSVEVDDVVQEACLRAWNGLDQASFAGESAFFGWLTVLARHVIADVARAARRRRRDARHVRLERSDWSRAGGVEPVDSVTGPLSRAARNEQRAHLSASFAALPAQYRRVIALRQFEQLSARAAAPKLGCTEAAVHALYRRALVAWGVELDRLESRG